MKYSLKSLAVAMLIALPSVSFAYHVVITEPAKERAYHRPAQNIEVQASISPRLEMGDTAAILLNGAVVADGVSASIPTLDLTVGEHDLEVIVMDKNANTIASDTRKIHVIQTNQIQRQKKAAIAKWQEYENSSIWHKIAVGLNPKVQAPQKVDETTPTWEINKPKTK